MVNIFLARDGCLRGWVIPVVIFVLGLVLWNTRPVAAAEPERVYLGLDRYGCNGRGAQCREFEAKERQRASERDYQRERLQQERERSRRTK